MRLSKLIGPDLKELLREDPEQVRALLQEIHAEDLADLVAELEPDEAAMLLQRLPADEAAPIFERLEEHEQGELAQLMPPESVAQIASEMAPDDRADLFSVLPPAVGDRLLATLERVDPEAAQDVREIEKWPETSAGHLMTTAFVQVPPDGTVAEAIQAVRAFCDESNSPVYNVYVVGKGDRLLGMASVRDLLLAKPDAPLSSITHDDVLSVAPDLDQEEVARRMAKYDLNVMPVIDEKEGLLGVITIDDIVDVLTQEQTEDVQKLGGVEPLDVPYFQTSFVSFIRKRGVWLLALFLGEFFTQTALRHYDPVFEAIHGAAYYVPLLISAGGNSGSQSSTLIIRGLAVGEVKSSDFFRILVRESLMGLVLGLGLALVGFVRVLMYPEQGVHFALTVSAALVGIVMTGCTVGSLLPIVLKRIGLDPATSSTPFIASLVDVLGIVIFVQFAKLIMAATIAKAAMGHP
jgi:magnesium transporter